MRKVVIVLLCIIVCSNAVAQSYSSRQLKGTWFEIYPDSNDEESYSLWTFTDNTIEEYRHFGKLFQKMHPNTQPFRIWSYPYYLDSSEPYFFNHAMPGKQTRGKYLVITNLDNRINVYKIHLEKNKLKIINCLGDTITFIRDKKKRLKSRGAK